MSQEQFSKYVPCSCHAIGHPHALDSLIGASIIPLRILVNDELIRAP